ncbi:MAG: tetratricopeptide repeat protein, partial [Trichodesmium sp. St2_bin6]|nr:tetratricopeptide repeat protein [Trichodesmium sp. St2_bin6]
KINSEFANAYKNRGNTYYNQGEYDLAINDYNQAIKINSEYPTTYYDRGLIYKATGNIEKAISDFEKAADLYKEQGNQKWYQNSLDRLKELRNN